jgi:anti-anti-sigma factor
MGEPQSFQLTREDIADGVSVLALQGDADKPCSEAVRAAIESARCEGRDVIVDLTSATYLDSPMVATLVGATEEGRRRGEPVVVVCTSERLRRSLQLKGLEPILRLACTREGAIELIADAGAPS